MEAGSAWFSISYTLMTDVTKFGDVVQDVEAAIRFVKSHAAEYRVNSSRIALIGESAGGQLAVIAAKAPSPELRVRAVVALYAPTDLLSLAQDSKYVPRWAHDNIQVVHCPGL
jgi:acetyl esterase/lipase